MRNVKKAITRNQTLNLYNIVRNDTNYNHKWDTETNNSRNRYKLQSQLTHGNKHRTKPLTFNNHKWHMKENTDQNRYKLQHQRLILAGQLFLLWPGWSHLLYLFLLLTPSRPSSIQFLIRTERGRPADLLTKGGNISGPSCVQWRLSYGGRKHSLYVCR